MAAADEGVELAGREAGVAAEEGEDGVRLVGGGDVEEGFGGDEGLILGVAQAIHQVLRHEG